MSFKKLVLIYCCCSAFLVIQPSFASTCKTDKTKSCKTDPATKIATKICIDGQTKMNAYIKKNSSLITNGCKVGPPGYGVVNVGKPTASRYKCSAICDYYNYQKSCTWTASQPIKTLNCTQIVSK
jgi:hypothetical protein